MSIEEMIAEAEVRASMIFENSTLADIAAKMNETEKCYIVLDGITVTDGDENGTSDCSQVIYLGDDNIAFLERITKLAEALNINSLLYIEPGEISQMGYEVAVKEKLLINRHEANFVEDLSCTFIDELNISYEDAVDHTYDKNDTVPELELNDGRIDFTVIN